MQITLVNEYNGAIEALMEINAPMLFSEFHDFNRRRAEAGERSPWSPEMLLELGKLLGATMRLQQAVGR